MADLFKDVVAHAKAGHLSGDCHLNKEKVTSMWVTGHDAVGRVTYLASTTEADFLIVPRPSYCDRGRFQVDVFCHGFPTNPNPFDSADGFPRYFFSLERAKSEIEDLISFRSMHNILD